MKKILAIALALLMVFALCACGSDAKGGDTSEAAYQAYLKEYVSAVPAVGEEQYAEFEALIDAGDYTTFPAEMLFNDMFWGYAAMTYDEFVAANGAYEIPAFDPNLTMDPPADGSGEPTEEPPAA